MASNKQTLWLEIRADDKASGAIAAVGDSVKRLPEGFAKASTAITTLGSAMGGIDGAAGAAIGKVSGLAQVMMSGGPLGIAIAATTAAVAVGTAVWAAHREEVEANEAAARALASSLDSYRAGAQAAAKLVADTRAELEGAGLSGEDKRLRDTDKRIGDITAGIESMAQANERLQAEIDAVWFSAERNGKLVGGQVVDTRKLNAEQERMIEGNRAIIAQNSAKVADLQREADLLQQASENMVAKSRVDSEAAAAAKRRAAASREAAAAEREAAAAAERETQAALDRYFAMADLEQDKIKRAEAEYARISDESDQRRQRGREDSIKRQAEVELAALEEVRRQQEANERALAGLAQSAGEAWISAFAAMGSGSEDAGATARRALAETARAAITSAAASAAAQAFFSQAGIPIFGPVAAGLASSAAYALVIALLDKVPKYALGGTVRGGSAGRDSVPAMLMPGEEVLSVPEANRYRRSRARGGDSEVMAAPVINVNTAMGFPTSKAEIDRWVSRMLVPSLRRLGTV